jgi:hypothetical protein
MWFFKLSLFQFFHFAKQVPAGRTGPRQFNLPMQWTSGDVWGHCTGSRKVGYHTTLGI